VIWLREPAQRRGSEIELAHLLDDDAGRKKIRLDERAELGADAILIFRDDRRVREA